VLGGGAGVNGIQTVSRECALGRIHEGIKMAGKVGMKGKKEGQTNKLNQVTR